MSTAHCYIREGPQYRRERFHAGLMANGYRVETREFVEFNPGDLLVIWNRYGHWEQHARRAEKVGVRVVVAENGYLQRPHFGGTHYALALEGHNGSGRWPHGGPERWDDLGIGVHPWRRAGDHILVAPNRGFGRPGFIQPENWAKDVVARLRQLTNRPIKLRPHPGNEEPAVPLTEDLTGAWSTVIWSSSAGIHSLLAGVPVVCCSPAWICKDAAGSAIEEAIAPPLPDRLPALRRLAWAQWTFAEVESGEAFAKLLA